PALLSAANHCARRSLPVAAGDAVAGALAGLAVAGRHVAVAGALDVGTGLEALADRPGRGEVLVVDRVAVLGGIQAIADPGAAVADLPGEGRDALAILLAPIEDAAALAQGSHARARLPVAGRVLQAGLLGGVRVAGLRLPLALRARGGG